jgi:hypothetical protein
MIDLWPNITHPPCSFSSHYNPLVLSSDCRILKDEMKRERREDDDNDVDEMGKYYLTVDVNDYFSSIGSLLIFLRVCVCLCVEKTNNGWKMIPSSVCLKLKNRFKFLILSECPFREVCHSSFPLHNFNNKILPSSSFIQPLDIDFHLYHSEPFK